MIKTSKNSTVHYPGCIYIFVSIRSWNYFSWRHIRIVWLYSFSVVEDLLQQGETCHKFPHICHLKWMEIWLQDCRFGSKKLGLKNDRNLQQILPSEVITGVFPGNKGCARILYITIRNRSLNFHNDRDAATFANFFRHSEYDAAPRNERPKFRVEFHATVND